LTHQAGEALRGRVSIVVDGALGARCTLEGPHAEQGVGAGRERA
jgi:hypothetical protein